MTRARETPLRALDVRLGLVIALIWAVGLLPALLLDPTGETVVRSLGRGLAAVLIVALRHRFPDLALVAAAVPYTVLFDPARDVAPSMTTQLLPIVLAAHACAAQATRFTRGAVLLLAGFGGLILSARDAFNEGSPTVIHGMAVLMPTAIAVTHVLLSVALVVSAVFLGDALRRQRVTAARLRWRNAELVRLRRVHEENAVAAERTIIARELHDVVAHHVAAVVVRAQAAERVSGSRPEEAVAAVGWIAEAGQEALAAMRQVVKVLRSTGSSGAGGVGGSVGVVSGPGVGAGLESVRAVVDRVREAGLEVGLVAPREWPVVDRQVELAAVRIVQECLTNVLVHARASRAVVRVGVVGEVLRIEVEDDGVTGTPPPAPGGPVRSAVGGRLGHGVIGMRERARALGGALRVSWGELGGWLVCAVLPLSGRGLTSAERSAFEAPTAAERRRAARRRQTELWEGEEGIDVDTDELTVLRDADAAAERIPVARPVGRRR